MSAIGGYPGAFLNVAPLPVVARIVGGCSNLSVKHDGHRYRVCVYRTVTGWGGFVESASTLEGFTGPHRSARGAWLSALRIVAGVES